ncbi:MAG TPA: sigma factor-like helix-turn-helix DNA-binding protein [Candidatus Limnocylindrales bacterium]|nr:sigma factor-like helix-turn-helix DNA-binding protein [Candidatus Limnocylindrales bacterium]
MDERGIVLIGDVVDSRLDLAAASDWSRRLSAELTALAPDDQLAPFDFTQGDEVQGLVRWSADPFRFVLQGLLHDTAPRMRWVIVAGSIERGQGSATRRTGQAYVAARTLVGEAKQRHDALLAVSGGAAADVLLDDLAPVLAASLTAMTPRQRTIARLMLLEGCRQADVAARLGISRATVSVAYGRGRVRDASRLLAAVRRIFETGLAQAGGAA